MLKRGRQPGRIAGYAKSLEPSCGTLKQLN
jgi:hypothetical protein